MQISYRCLVCAVSVISSTLHSAAEPLARDHALKEYYAQMYSHLNIGARGTNSSSAPDTFTSPSDFDGQVKWEYMTSKDGIKSGSDSDKIWYVKHAINVYLRRVKPEQRNGVFWSGGATTQDDFYNMDEFIESPSRLDGNGVKMDMVYSVPDFHNMGIDDRNRVGLYWRALNRISKALAACASGDGVAYVYLNPVNSRTIFSQPSQSPKDEDPAHNNQATNGEVWYYAELPMLMRNLNIKQIVSFYKQGRKFVTKVEWDADKDQTTYPRNKFEDIAMDESPIILPAAAGRPPLKRGVGQHGIW